MHYTLITANRNYSSWSLRPWLLMKALGIPFEDRLEPFTKPGNYEDFRAFSPTGQVPLLLDGERRVWDSLGIALYLAERHAGVWPGEEEAQAFAQAVVAEMHGGFGALQGDLRDERRRAGGAQARCRRRCCATSARLREIFEQGARAVRRTVASAGAEFTAADAFYAPVAFTHPHLRPRRRPRRRMGRTGDRAPGDAGLGSPGARRGLARESHEAELAAAGTVTADYRQG